jgi:hypothetical protein
LPYFATQGVTVPPDLDRENAENVQKEEEKFKKKKMKKKEEEKKRKKQIKINKSNISWQ